MKIAVVRALQLGDLMCAVPALRALDAAYPQARITLVGLPWARQFAARFSRYLDDFVEFPGFPGMPERECDPAALPPFFERMQRQRFDLALQMHGNGNYMNPITVLMRARRTAGFHAAGRYCPDPASFLEWQDEEHEVLRYLRLLENLGIPAAGEQLEFPLTQADWAEWRAWGLDHYVCVHPGSQLPSRRWPAERFAEVADRIAAGGAAVVLTGTAAEAPLTRRVAGAMRHRAIDLAGKTSLGGLAALIARARLLVSNDTGVSHIAVAVRTPSIVVASGSDPRRWAPLDRGRHRVLAHDVSCRPCMHRDCPVGHPCALGVSVHEVLHQTASLLPCVA